MQLDVAVGAGPDERNRREEGVLIVRLARIERERAAVLELVRQRADDLVALIGGILGVTDALLGPIEAADAAIPTVAEVRAIIAIYAVLASGPVGELGEASRVVLAVLLHEVDRRARLAVAEQHGLAADRRLDALDRLVEADLGRVVEE